MKTGSDKLYARNSATSRFYFPTRTRTMRERSALIDVLIDVASFLPSFFLPFLSFFFFFLYHSACRRATRKNTLFGRLVWLRVRSQRNEIRVKLSARWSVDGRISRARNILSIFSFLSIQPIDKDAVWKFASYISVYAFDQLAFILHHTNSDSVYIEAR